MSNVDNASGLLDSIFQCQGTVGARKIKLLELSLCSLSSFAGCCAIVTLEYVSSSLETQSRVTYPIEATRLDHVEARAALLDRLILNPAA